MKEQYRYEQLHYTRNNNNGTDSRVKKNKKL